MKIKELLEKYGNIEINEEKEKELKYLLGVKESKKWQPRGRDKYYYVSEAGQILNDCWNYHRVDYYRFNINNCFETKEEAEFRLEQIKVYNGLRTFADEYNDIIDWKNCEQNKYVITYDHYNNIFVFGIYNQFIVLGTIYFTSKELAEQAVEKIGVERIKKYLFGVE